jgi:hypothetical protein
MVFITNEEKKHYGFKTTDNTPVSRYFSLDSSKRQMSARLLEKTEKMLPDPHVFVLVFLLVKAALMNSLKRGCGFVGRDLNSG